MPVRVSQTKPPPLREKVAVGVYKRTTRAGATRYEIAYAEAGRQRWRTVGSLREAKLLRADLVSKIGRGERVTPSKLTVAELAESWYESKSSRLRPSTARYYRDALDLVIIPRFGTWKIAAVDADAIAKLVRDLEREGLHAVDPSRPDRPLGHSSIRNYLKPLQGVLAFAVRRGHLIANPFAVLTVDDRPERGERQAAHEWTDAELDVLFAASAQLASRQGAKYDYTPLLRLIATLGLRKGEALGLNWEDFDRTAGVLHVRRQWLARGSYGPPKTKAGNRRIALPTDLRDELVALRLRSRFSLDSDPIFASLSGKPLGARNVSARGFEPARDRAGLPSSLTLHDLRHAAASRLINAGLDPVTVAAVLGHEDATVTLKIYAHVWDRERTDDDVRKALAGTGGTRQ
jgi:integrase